eukprot:1161371-Pelagomonas_calceolata.AAC.9
MKEQMKRDSTWQDAAHACPLSSGRGKDKSSTRHEQKCTTWMLKQKDTAGWQEPLDSSNIQSTLAHRPNGCPSGLHVSLTLVHCVQLAALGPSPLQVSRSKSFYWKLMRHFLAPRSGPGQVRARTHTHTHIHTHKHTHIFTSSRLHKCARKQQGSGTWEGIRKLAAACAKNEEAPQTSITSPPCQMWPAQHGFSIFKSFTSHKYHCIVNIVLLLVLPRWLR